MYKIESVNKKNIKTADFFVNSIGLDSGCPVKTATPSSFAITTNREFLLPEYFYYFILNAYKNKRFYKMGSVIPFITIESFKKDLENV
tara:strand:- start:5476 stop:5739 length:264 start_codon:yes stop_codon:yes gene_type:complete